MAEEDTEGQKTYPGDRAGREMVPGVPVKKAAKAKAKVAVPLPVPVKRYSFTQWAARNGVREHHRGGLRAFINNVSKHRTLEEWDKCFEGY